MIIDRSIGKSASRTSRSVCLVRPGRLPLLNRFSRHDDRHFHFGCGFFFDAALFSHLKSLVKTCQFIRPSVVIAGQSTHISQPSHKGRRYPLNASASVGMIISPLKSPGLHIKLVSQLVTICYTSSSGLGALCGGNCYCVEFCASF